MVKFNQKTQRAVVLILCHPFVSTKHGSKLVHGERFWRLSGIEGLARPYLYSKFFRPLDKKTCNKCPDKKKIRSNWGVSNSFQTSPNIYIYICSRSTSVSLVLRERYMCMITTWSSPPFPRYPVRNIRRPCPRVRDRHTRPYS